MPISIALRIYLSGTDHFLLKCLQRKRSNLACAIVCQNALTKLRGINTFQKREKLQPIYSVTKNLKSQEADDANHALQPEQSSKKNVSYYVFEAVLESYVKEGVTKAYTGTTRVYKNESVCEIYADLVASGESYLYHRSIVDDINAFLPKIREFYR